MENARENQAGAETQNKLLTIIVNGQQKPVAAKELSFAEVVALAFNPVPTGPNIIFTVTYRKGEDDKQGSLIEGGSVKVKNGMIFNVTATDKS